MCLFVRTLTPTSPPSKQRLLGSSKLHSSLATYYMCSNMAAFNSGAWFCAKVAACRGKCLVWSSFFKKQSICFGDLKLSSWMRLHHGWRHFFECFLLCFFGWGGFVVELRMKSLLQAAQPGKSRRQKLLWEVAPYMCWQLFGKLVAWAHG